jgi:hypothetical protein
VVVAVGGQRTHGPVLSWCRWAIDGDARPPWGRSQRTTLAGLGGPSGVKGLSRRREGPSVESRTSSAPEGNKISHGKHCTAAQRSCLLLRTTCHVVSGRDGGATPRASVVPFARSFLFPKPFFPRAGGLCPLRVGRSPWSRRNDAGGTLLRPGCCSGETSWDPSPGSAAVFARFAFFFSLPRPSKDPSFSAGMRSARRPIAWPEGRGNESTVMRHKRPVRFRVHGTLSGLGCMAHPGRLAFQAIVRVWPISIDQFVAQWQQRCEAFGRRRSLGRPEHGLWPEQNLVLLVRVPRGNIGWDAFAMHWCMHASGQVRTSSFFCLVSADNSYLQFRTVQTVQLPACMYIPDRAGTQGAWSNARIAHVCGGSTQYTHYLLLHSLSIPTYHYE